MVSKLTLPATENEVQSKINELVDDKQDTISDLATIRSGATGNVKLNGGSSQQTISLTSGTGTTALGVKSMSNSSYISFNGSSGWLASLGINSSKKPTVYDGSSHTIAYTTDIPTNNNQLTNGAGYITSSALTPYALSADLATVATSGSYNDLSNKPTIPTVNNATLTIQKNGTDVATFTANASSNVTANISVPTTTSSVTSGSSAALTSGGAYTALQSYQTTANLVTSVSSSSTDSQYPSAKLFYDTVGDIEAALHTINSAESVTLTVVRTGTYASGNENGSVGITINDVIYAGSDFVNNQLEVEFPKNTEVVWSSISTGSGSGHLYSTPSNGTLTLTNDTTLTLEINIYSGGVPDKY